MPSYCPPIDKITFTLVQLLKHDIRFEIILVLQKTPAKTIADIERQFTDSRLRIVVDDGVGISRARNKGIKHSLGDWLLFLDDDIVVEHEALARFVKGEDFSGNKAQFYYGNLYIHGTNRHYLNYPLKGKDVGFFSYNRICSVMLVIKKELFKKIGPFDERMGSGTFFGAYEEADIIIQALLKGIKIKYLADYSIYHEAADYGEDKVIKYARGTGALYRKHWFKGNFILDIKLISDLLIRILLLFTLKKKRRIWFKGFIEGYLNFGKTR